MFQRIAKPFRVSIHALLAESDIEQKIAVLTIAVSIHALLAESDVDKVSYQYLSSFLSTLSLRRATLRKVPLLGIK